MSKTLDQKTHYQILSLLEQFPELSQRELAKKMGVSVGKVNYCIKALVDVGHLKLNNFIRSDNKLGYAYLLTPKAIKEKIKITLYFLALKQVQYEHLKKKSLSLRRRRQLMQQQPKYKGVKT